MMKGSMTTALRSMDRHETISSRDGDRRVLGFDSPALQRTVAAFYFFTVCLWGLDHPSLSILVHSIAFYLDLTSCPDLTCILILKQTGLHFCIFIAMPSLDLEFDFLPPWGLLSKFETLNWVIDPRKWTGYELGFWRFMGAHEPGCVLGHVQAMSK